VGKVLWGHCDVLGEVGYEIYVAAQCHQRYFLKAHRTDQVATWLNERSCSTYL
jgi:hypothetical protein